MKRFMGDLRRDAIGPEDLNTFIRDKEYFYSAASGTSSTPVTTEITSYSGAISPDTSDLPLASAKFYRWVVGEDWATIRAGAGTHLQTFSTSGDTWTGSIAGIGTKVGSTLFNVLYRCIILYDSSNIAVAAMLDSGEVWLKEDPTGINQDTLGVNPSMNLYEFTGDINSLSAADYQSFGTVPLSDTPIALDDWNFNGYNKFTLNAAGLALVNKGGISVFGFRLTCDAENVAPSPLIPNAMAAFSGWISSTGLSNIGRLVINTTEDGETEYENPEIDIRSSSRSIIIRDGRDVYHPKKAYWG